MTRINSLKIKNFKSINEAILDDCRRVNVLIGYPNVGKSNILEAISLLTFIPEKNRPIGLKGLVRLEKLSHLFNYNNVQAPAILSFNDDYALFVNYQDENLVTISLEKNNEVKSYDFSLLNLRIGKETLFTGNMDGMDNFSGRFPELQKLNVKPYKFSDEKIFNETYSAVDLKVPFGKNLFELISNNSEIQKEFSELLKPYRLDLVIDVSGNDVKISPPVKDGIIKTIPISLMAETLIRLIFFKTAIISNKNAVLLFEEPESHMFPPYIGKLTSDIIFDKNENQYFITTHSPFVLNDFIEEMDRDQLSIYLVGLKDGETKIERLSDEEVSEVSLYGVDLFFNMESYFNNGPVGNA